MKLISESLNYFSFLIIIKLGCKKGDNNVGYFFGE